MASETVHDVTESYANERFGTLPEHPLEGSTMSELLGLEKASTWGKNECNKLLTIFKKNVLYHAGGIL